MLNLIRNENMKIYRRIRTWILIGIVVVVAVTMSIFIYRDARQINNNSNWKENLAQQNAGYAESIKSPGLPKSLQDDLQKRILANEYRIQHNLPPSDNDVWSYVMTVSQIVGLVTILTVIVAADIVAGEFAGGTIKLLLIRPASRSKILLSKYIATLLFAIFLLLVLFGTAFVMGGLLTGFQNVGTPYIFVDKSMVVHERSMLIQAFQTYGLQCVELIMIVTLAFMISTVFRSSSLAIGISMLIMMVGSAVMALISKYEWSKYYLFANTDLTPYLQGNPRPGMTLGFSITVLIVYFVVFNALSWTIFRKRDVAA